MRTKSIIFLALQLLVMSSMTFLIYKAVGPYTAYISAIFFCFFLVNAYDLYKDADLTHLVIDDKLRQASLDRQFEAWQQRRQEDKGRLEAQATKVKQAQSIPAALSEAPKRGRGRPKGSFNKKQIK